MLVNRMLQQRLIQQHRIWNFWNDNALTTTTTNSPPPSKLFLKTKPYHAVDDTASQVDETADDDDPAACCIICFVPLEEGDRIGDLSCDHVYHVDCLKGWVQRKNSCPLCATPMATSRTPSGESSNNV
jgi:hypothetical protein